MAKTTEVTTVFICDRCGTKLVSRRGMDIALEQGWHMATVVKGSSPDRGDLFHDASEWLLCRTCTAGARVYLDGHNMQPWGSK